MRTYFFTLSLLLLTFATSTQKAKAITTTKEVGWLESAYIIWQPVKNTESYNVYYSGEGITNQKIDDQLIRQYSDYYRADILGLKAGKYTITVKAVNKDGIEFESTTSSELIVKAHTREGFAFKDVTGGGKIIPGAYNEDGTPKTEAKIIYITANNVNTVKCVVINERGIPTTITGLMEILNAKGKGYDKTPLIIRMIGLIKHTHINGIKDYIAFTGSNTSNRLIENITFEGVGNDATAHGYGFFTKRSKSIEVRNVGIMMFGDDGVSMEADNFNIWIHNNDFFYGAPGGDSDQVKGDGSIDMKYNTTNITISFNHFWDSGKTTFAGGATESNPIYFTYHHNWFDHSDSRHPRLCHATTHIYNNYFDANPTMCLLNTETSSAFVEANYYRKCPFPMMINMQGTNYKKWPDGEQNGGMTKSYNNIFDGTHTLIYQTENLIDFDAYLVNSRDEQIPETVKSKKGGNVYSNFDTKSDMYAYTPDAPQMVPEVVTAYAGRIDGGDLKWTFSVEEDGNKNIIPELKNAVVNYTSSLISVQGDLNEDPDEGEIVVGSGGGICDLLSKGAESGFTIVGSTTDNKGSVTVNGTIYTCCLKMGSSSKVAFSTSELHYLVLYFADSEGKKVKIDGVKGYSVANGIIRLENLPIGTHTIERDSGESNLFYIALVSKNETGIQAPNKDIAVFYKDGFIHNPHCLDIQLFNIEGQLLLSNNNDIEITNLPKGIYLVHIKTLNQIIKIIN